MTQFTLGWKIAIIVALVASFTAIGRSDRQKHTDLKYEQRLSEIEKSLKEIVEHAQLPEKSK